MAELTVVGQSLTRLDAWEKVTGKARFCADFTIPGMVYAKVLRSVYPHARIIRIDTTRAEKLPGVNAVITGRDAPDLRIGYLVWDQYVLARDSVVRAVGEPVAAVAAESREIAEDAVGLIEVEYEEMPAIFDPEASLEADPPVVIHPEFATYFALVPPGVREKWPPNVCFHAHIHDGNMEKGFEEADLIVENKFSTSRVHPCQLETHRADAWVEPDGTLVVRTSTQGVYGVKEVLGTLFNLSPAKLRIMSSYIGGGFGGKCGVYVEPIVALLAMKSGRPVRLVLTREEQFVDSSQRPTIISHFKDGVKKDGTIVARQIRLVVDCARHSGLASIVTAEAGFGTVGTYRVPNYRLDTYGVYTNNPITGAFRGFGVTEILWGLEQQMDMIAEQAGIDPVELRRKHILREGEVDASGRVTYSIGAKECLDKVAEWVGWGQKSKRQKGPWKKGKGIALGCKFTSANFVSVAHVKVYPDATIEIRHGTGELGQGVNTVLAQMAAEEFRTSLERVRVVYGDTAFVPYDFLACSSRCTFYTGNAVVRACRDAKRQIFDIASGILKVNPVELEIKDGIVSAPAYPGKSIQLSDLFTGPTGEVALKGGEILGKDYFTSPGVFGDPETGKSEKQVAYYTYMAHAVEVEVNTETGQVKVSRIGGAFDVVPINPKMVEAQIESGFAMGIGTALYEQIIMEKGHVVNPSFRDYVIPTAAEIPNNQDVQGILTSVPHREGPFGAKGIGESVLITVAPAIGNAVHNAVGVRIHNQPISQEKVLGALRERKTGGQ